MNNLSKCIATGLLTILAGSVVSISAQAEGKPGHGPAPFSVFDMDENGFVSEAEFNSVREQRMAARVSEGKKMRCAASAPAFADLDTDGDGQLSPEELTAGQNAHMSKCRAMGQGTGHGKGEGHGNGMKGKMPAFSDFDLDGDGVIIETEFNEGHAKRMSEMAAEGRQMKHVGDAPGFSGIDINGDGGISEQEFSDHQAEHHKEMKNKSHKKK
jgi:Ca2+-binding EF-hand superfamily protein